MTLNSARKARLHEHATTIIGLAVALLLAACIAPEPTAAGKAVEQADAVAVATHVAGSALHEPEPVQRVEAASARAEIARAEPGGQGSEAGSGRYADAEPRIAAQDLKRQIDELKAQVTDRGLVMILGDVLFASAIAELELGNDERLGALAGFLNKYPGCSAVIDGYTDNVGNDAYNRGLSQRRADAVRIALMNRGVGSARLIATGRGESSPVGDNYSLAGRQQNRRVEVLIENTLVTSRQSCL